MRLRSSRHAPLAAVLLTSISASGLLALAQDPAGEETEPAEVGREKVRELFAANCASCHGEKGDGEGVTDLDRKARSFQDGGFSYGNTPEALFRTISTGIPGTPMPGFDLALSETERRAVAAYVLELGPEGTKVERKDTLITVEGHPRIARGPLPPIVEGASSVSRGLLIGTVDGFSFEYATDDVRLLGVRQGGFLERTDWIGRGGTPLAPLGVPIYLLDDGQPPPTFRLPLREFDPEAPNRRGPPLRAVYGGTWMRDAEAGVAYRLVDRRGVALAEVEERPSGVSTSLGAGIRRRFELRSLGAAVALEVHAATKGERPTLAGQFGRRDEQGAFLEHVYWYAVHERPGGVHQFVAWRVGPGTQLVPEIMPDALVVLEPNGSRELEVFIVLLPDWPEKPRELLETMDAELFR